MTIKKIRSSKTKEAHVSKTGKPMGDFFGQGVRQKVGRVGDSFLDIKTSKNQMKKPPKALA